MNPGTVLSIQGEVVKVKEEIKKTPLAKDILEILLDQLKSPNNTAEAYSNLELIEIFNLYGVCSLPKGYHCDKMVVTYALQDILNEK